MKARKFSDLVGALVTYVDAPVDADEAFIFTRDSGGFRLFHYQDCCENVWIADVVGDWWDIIGQVIVSAEEVENADPADKPDDIYGDIQEWTFYHLRTAKGDVTIRFCGRSNGYCSVGVDVESWEGPQ